MTLSIDLQQLIDEALAGDYSHPRHELIHTNWEKFFELFRTSYTKTGKWLAILAARKVQPIFEENGMKYWI